MRIARSSLLIAHSSSQMPNPPQTEQSPKLIRGIGLGGATALNMIDMIGVGPFITMPLVVAAMGGPQALLGWVLGAILAICDGLVWAELGAAMPGAGGSYVYLREIYGPQRLGKLVSFLFIWQLSFSAPLSIASGAIGFAKYTAYLWPGLETKYSAHEVIANVPLLGPLKLSWVVAGTTFLAIGIVLLAMLLLSRRITQIGNISKLLWLIVMATIGWIIFAGFTHFNSARAFSYPPGAFELKGGFWLGLGSAMLIATYDYWGAYNVCFLGDELKDPGRTIPRAVLLSILVVAGLYLLMNVSVLGVVDWHEVIGAANSNNKLYVFSTFMQRIYGNWAANLITALIMLTAFASVFSLVLGYSRVPYAAALDGNYFKVFARLHPEYRFPHISLLALGGAAIVFCFLPLAEVISALVVIRILLQFILQAVGVIVLRIRRPELPRPFRMWLYPLPAILAFVGFAAVAAVRRDAWKEIRYTVVIVIAGLIIYAVRAFRNHDWPFSQPAPSAEITQAS
jgi:basic amino acid/polyamine antiporter, APA family